MMMLTIIVAVVVVFVTLILISFLQTLSLKTPAFTNWPFIGMLPQFLRNLSNIHEFSAKLLNSKGGTIEFIGPWFTNMKGVITTDPMNVHHIMSKSFTNYVKGDLFREMFKPFGVGIFTTDSHLWKFNRNLLQYIFKQRSFEDLQERIIHNKVETSLIPLLNHVQQQKGLIVDLQDIFNRFTFDNICSIILGHDPNCLSIDFPEIECEKAFNQAEESIFYRHTVPLCVWRLQKWLQIGEEKKMTDACKVFDHFLYDCIASKREELTKNSNKNQNIETDESHVDLLTYLITEEEKKGESNDDKFLRDAAFNLFVAGRDTITSSLTWLFYLVATHPLVEAKILEEIKEKFGHKEKPWILNVDEVKNLVYLHGAICEALRLFPPIPFERKESVEKDVLPSGHHVHPNTMILFSLYAMGRSENIWGEDCLEFKPERWISERGGIVYAPSYKFFSFNAGPRTCLGKDLAFIQIKMVAASILWNYGIHVVEGNCVTPSLSIVLLMKHGLKVKITKRGV
ncbi:alkane hydroxylase MAH1-like [Cicer arietinum]|uniref:Alkane hydroxylase MAH1-like n=1 Tax=Cicer arietinum TaxID=3827 RepID=A0A1S2XGY7_CICAR|nr:alkane hydroxylase MAH1-like [Cicer arietinum]